MRKGQEGLEGREGLAGRAGQVRLAGQARSAKFELPDREDELSVWALAPGREPSAQSLEKATRQCER